MTGALPSMSPERRLWVNVIALALRDAFVSTDKSQLSEISRREAREWLLMGCKDFNEVCSLAGIDPGRLMDLSRRAARDRHVAAQIVRDLRCLEL